MSQDSIQTATHLPRHDESQLEPSDAATDSQSSLSSQSFRVVDVPQQTARQNQTGAIISRIEHIFESMVDVLARGGDVLSIPYRSRRTPSQTPGVGALNFPGRTVNEATKFTRMIRIMELSREALVSGHVITKRNIYYQDPGLFKKQSVVDELVDDLAHTLQVGRNALNIVAASKGLMAGLLGISVADGSVLSYSLGHDSNDTIPPASAIQQIDFAETRWILVLEKEATFRTLATSRYWENSIHGQGIIVTAKGYADLATLEFLNLVHSVRPLIPIFCVVDCDPHGIDILRAYKYGSKGMAHENNARVSGLQWLGVKMSDVLGGSLASTERNVPEDSIRRSGQPSSGDHAAHSGARLRRHNTPLAADFLVALTAGDRKTAQRIIKTIDQGGGDNEWEELEQVRELQMMLMLNLKAEIQAIDNMGDLSEWLDEKMGVA